jgi:hypothetical protein
MRLKTFSPLRAHLQRVERGGDGCAGVIGNVFKKRRVGVEVLRDFQSREHFGRVGAENLRVVLFSPGNPGLAFRF